MTSPNKESEANGSPRSRVVIKRASAPDCFSSLTSIIRRVYLKSMLSGSLLGIAVSAHAQGTSTLTFDEFSLPFYGETEPMPNGYASLQWTNFYVLNPHNAYPGRYGSGFLNAVVSPENVVWNGNGNPAQISRTTPFDLDSAYITADWMDGLQIEAQGFIGKTMAYDSVYTVNTVAPTLVNFDYVGVNEVNFIASGGTPHYPAGFGPEFAIDNMIVTVPEPSRTSLFLLGLACIWALQRKL